MPIKGDRYIWSDRARYASEEPGVYELIDSKGNTIFIGAAKSLKDRFNSYVTTSFDAKKCKKATKYYRREVGADFEERRVELLEEYADQNNGSPPKCNKVVKKG